MRIHSTVGCVLLDIHTHIYTEERRKKKRRNTAGEQFISLTPVTMDTVSAKLASKCATTSSALDVPNLPCFSHLYEHKEAWSTQLMMEERGKRRAKKKVQLRVYTCHYETHPNMAFIMPTWPLWVLSTFHLMATPATARNKATFVPVVIPAGAGAGADASVFFPVVCLQRRRSRTRAYVHARQHPWMCTARVLCA